MNRRICKKILTCASSLCNNSEKVKQARDFYWKDMEYFINKHSLYIHPIDGDDRVSFRR